MRKSEAIKIHGETETDLALAVGVSKQYVNQWPNDLNPKQVDWVLGAAVRLGKKIPAKYTNTKPETKAA